MCMCVWGGAATETKTDRQMGRGMEEESYFLVDMINTAHRKNNVSDKWSIMTYTKVDIFIMAENIGREGLWQRQESGYITFSLEIGSLTGYNASRSTSMTRFLQSFSTL